MKASEIKRELEVGDIIVKDKMQWSSGETWVIGEILSQDYYKDEDAVKYDIEDKSYIEIEFKDKDGVYHSWKSNVDGGSVIYINKNTRSRCNHIFRKMLLTQGKTIGEINDSLLKEGFKRSEIYQTMVDVMGDMCFRN